MQHETKLLLTGVFGPYGVTNEYAEGLGMQMELLNNQITREQNIHSIRQHYWTLPLYLLAENVSVPSVVLDFPSWEEFTDELENGYTHIGINFIVPNVLKVKRMTEYIRERYPSVKIILGGYGTIIPELDKILPYDELCKGEGVRWLRTYFDEDPEAPIIHPIVQNPISQSVYGFSSVPTSSVIMPGLGCKNGCDFCITSHKFGKQYISLLPTGKDIFDACLKIHKAMKAQEFFIMDENFLKQPEKAIELLHEMEQHELPFNFQMFSSAEVINQLGVDFLVRLGVKMIWVGVESQAYSHSKLKGMDLKALIEKLQNHGISINTSAILFLDHHTEEILQDDIDWTISLGADMTQFMNYTPYPTTTLYQRLEKEGRLKDMDYRYQTGQGELNWVHPHIQDPVKHFEYTKNAFKKKYETGGSAVLNMAITAVNGYTTAKDEYAYRLEHSLSWNPETRKYEKSNGDPQDKFFEKRLETLRKAALALRPILLVNQIFAPNNEARQKAVKAQKLYEDAFGKQSIKEMIMASGLVTLATRAAAEHAIAKLRGEETVVMQPPSQRVEYNMREPKVVGKVFNTGSPLETLQIWRVERKLKKSTTSFNPISWVVDTFKQIDKQTKNSVMYFANLLYTD